MLSETFQILYIYPSVVFFVIFGRIKSQSNSFIMFTFKHFPEIEVNFLVLQYFT